MDYVEQAVGGLGVDPASGEERESRHDRVRPLRAARGAAAVGVWAGAPGRCRSRLSAVDITNTSFAFAALAVLCRFPFLAVVDTPAGADVRQAIITSGGVGLDVSCRSR